MTARTRFGRAVWFIRSKGIRVVIGPPRRLAQVTGRAHLFRHARCWIVLWPPEPETIDALSETKRPSRETVYDQLTACLLHEYGHIVLRYVAHSEVEAWRFGRRAVPSQIVPALYARFARRCLATYGSQARRRLIGVVGLRYRWVPKKRAASRRRG